MAKRLPLRQRHRQSMGLLKSQEDITRHKETSLCSDKYTSVLLGN